MTPATAARSLFRQRIDPGEAYAAVNRGLTSSLLQKKVLFWALALFCSAWFFFETVSFTAEWDTDSPSYYTAAHGLLQKINLYDDREFMPLADSLFGKGLVVYPYIYPPLLAQLFLPIAVLPAAKYFLFLYVLNIVLVFAAVVLIIRLLDLDRAPSILAAVFPFALLIANEPLLTTIHHGQINLLVLDAILVSLLFQKNGKPGRAGFFLSLAVFIKIYPVLLVLPFVFFKRWRRLAAFTLSSLGLLTASVLLSGTKPWLDFLRSTVELFVSRPDSPFTRGFQDSLGNVSLKNFLGEFVTRLGLPASFVAPLLAVFLAAAFAVIFFHPRKSAVSRDLGLEASLLLVLTLVFAPITWSHHFVLLLLPAAYLFKRILGERRYGGFVVLALLLSQIFYVLPWGAFPFNQVRLFATLGLFGLLIYFARGKPRISHA
jgi:hypothetical protein